MKLLLVLLYVLRLNVAMCQEGGTNVIFREDFEASSMKEMLEGWNAASSKNVEGMMLTQDVPGPSSGKQSLMMTHNPGTDEGGHLFKSFPEGYDSLFVRFYVKFPTRKVLHHFVKLGGYNPATSYPQGNAGNRSKGDESFVTGIEAIGNSWNWDFYTYWMHMRGSPNPGKYWGNSFQPNPTVQIPKGEWICVEFMVKMNIPVSAYNGEQALWINGKKVQHLGENFPKGDWTWGKFLPNPDGAPFEGFQWRTDEKLNLNFFWLDYYMAKGIKGEVEKILFDDIIISTKYIGPMK